MARLTAALTVLAAVLAAPLLSRRTATSLDLGSLAPAPAVRLGPLPENWSLRITRELSTMGVPMDREEIEALVEAVDRSARRFGVDPLLVLAVIFVESGFDRYAISPAGAAGLMQLRPETARALAGELRIEWTSDDQVFDPGMNVLLGTCYLRRMLDRFQDLDAALAAFNSGPTRISIGRSKTGSVPLRYADRVWDAVLDLRLRVDV